MKVDFGRVVGRMKPVHGVNNGPRTYALHTDMSKYFVEAGIPYSRLHDTEYPYGSGHFVDIPCIFKDFNADPEDPASYDFFLTDEYIKAIHAVGTKVFYRLGVSIEHAAKKYHIFPPKDYNRWAKICEGIIRHYNEGWADGFRYGITYWEIWNEPENPPMWQGTQEDYFRLYVCTSKKLKARFPGIKVGGYAGCGFYGLTRENATDFQKTFVPWFTDFLRYLKLPEHQAPLDFFSWHLYSCRIEEYKAHAEYVAKTLVDHGFNNTENILDEWNGDHSFAAMRTLEGAALVAGVLCELQKSSVDLGAYYDGQPAMPWCGIFDHCGPLKPYYAFKAFNALYRLGNEVEAVSEGAPLHVCAAASGVEGAILISNYRGDCREVTVNVSGLEARKGVRLEVYHLDAAGDLELRQSEIHHGSLPRPVLTLGKDSVVLLKVIKLECAS